MARPGSKEADITSFAALLGDGFASKVNLLTQIVQSNHYPSIGRYKEKLLAKMIAEYIPGQFSVGTGFVLFANEADDDRANSELFDTLNMSSHSLSKQCDIIVFDASKYPVVFKDDDFVIVRPESVKAIIEVKGKLNHRELNDILGSFLDFGRKWRRTQNFYRKHYQALTYKPSLQAMCWDVGKFKSGTPQLNGQNTRDRIVRFYASNLEDSEMTAFPVLSHLFLYNKWHINYAASMTKNPDKVEIGWGTSRGKFLRLNTQGEVVEDGDRTIAALLASLHHCVSNNFNRFYSYPDEVKEQNTELNQPDFTPWLSETDKIRALNSDYIDGKLRHEVESDK